MVGGSVVVLAWSVWRDVRDEVLPIVPLLNKEGTRTGVVVTGVMPTSPFPSSKEEEMVGGSVVVLARDMLCNVRYGVLRTDPLLQKERTRTGVVVLNVMPTSSET